MRDVTQPPPGQGPKKIFNLESLPECFYYLVHFLKSPIESIKTIPQWTWKDIFLVHFTLSALSGFVAGVFKINLYTIVLGLFIMPFISLIGTALLSSFIYYFFQIFEGKTIEFRRIATLAVLANFPFYLFQIAGEYLPPATLVGFAFSGILFIVGLTENFGMAKRRSIQLIGFLFCLIFVIWVWNQYDLAKYR